MPAVIPAHIALRSELRDFIKDALELNARLEAVIAVKSRQPSENTRHGRIDHSQPPWNAVAAGVILELHAWSRSAEKVSKGALSFPKRERGGSTRNTAKALESLAALSESLLDADVKEHIRWLRPWCRRASIALGDIERPKRLPRSKGSPEPSCPFCQKMTLRMWPLHGEIKCVKPDCYDENGKKPVARLEYSSYAGDMVLIWMDGVVGLP